MMDLDKILLDINEFGKYQQKLLLYVFLPCMFPCAFHAYNQLFMVSALPHCCHSEKSSNYLKNNTSRDLKECITGFEEFNFKNFAVRMITKEFLICETNFRLTLGLVLFGIAGFIGSFIFGYLQDKIGRKPSFFFFLLIECVFGIGTAFANNYWVWLLMRCGVGFTVPAILSTPYVLPIELVGPKYRTRCTIFSNIAYSLALVSLAGVVYFFQNWRFLSLITTIPFMLFFFYWWHMPESPRWLMACGKINETVQILKKMAKINGKLISEDYLVKIKDELIKKQSSLSAKNSNTYGIKDLFRTANLRKRTIIISFIWFTNTSVYVGLSYYAPVLSGDKFFNFFIAGIAELPTYIILWPAMEQYGRREILCLSMLIGGMACLATTVITPRDQIVRILYCIGKMGISSSYVVLPLFASELFPTMIRGIGMSIGSVAGMLGPIFIPIINYLGFGSHFPLLIMGLLLVCGGLFSLLLPETKNTHLPDTIPEN